MQAIQVQNPSAQRNKATPPDAKKVKLKFDYSPSSDGIDLNLLILLHGLGDTKIPFTKLGQQLKYPQTATLSVQAPEPVPYMEECYQWFPSFDIMTGHLLPPGHPERMKGLKRTRALMEEILTHLIEHSGFNPSNIFFFGFSQGATVALDTVLFGKIRNLGGVVSISGYILEEQQREKIEGDKYGGYILITQGEKDQTIGDKSVAEERFKAIQGLCKSSVKLSQVFITNKDHIMPKSESEWKVIHTFFGKHMPRRNLQLENMSDVYLVNSNP